MMKIGFRSGSSRGSAVATKRRATRNNNCSSVATVNYPEPPPPWRSRGSGYAGKLTKGSGTRSRRW